MLLLKSRNVLQLRNCLNQFNQINYQSNLARAIKLNNQFNNSPVINQSNNESNKELINRSNQFFNSKSVLNSTKKQIENDQLKTPKKDLNKSAGIGKSRNLVNKLNNSDDKLPDREKLEQFYQYIENMVRSLFKILTISMTNLILKFPKFFIEKVNLVYFDQYVLIEDNQTDVSKKTRGYDELVKKISFIRIYYSLMYSQNNMNVLSIAKIPSEGLVKVRWRIVSRGKLLIFIKFWKFLDLTKKENWNDGIVYFYLDKTGKVNRIVIEKVILELIF